MPIISLSTDIAAPPQRVFDLSRCIDLHAESMTTHGEKAIAGVTSGLIELGQTVTWRARHFGIWQHLTSQITLFDPPCHFRDSQVQGAFQRFDHDHICIPIAQGTRLIDLFDYTSPLGVLGNLVDLMVLKKYMTSLLTQRNQVIKMVAESQEWQRFLPAAITESRL
jgi:ligand-binding SRPBCC domain-containing protein